MGIKAVSIKVKSPHFWRPFTDRETPRSPYLYIIIIIICSFSCHVKNFLCGIFYAVGVIGKDVIDI